MLTAKDLEKYHQAAERILNAMDNSPVPISWHEMDRMACLVAQDITTGSMRLLLKIMWNVSLSAKVMQTIWWSEARYPLEMPQL